MEFASKLRWILVITVMVIVLILISWGLYSIAQNTFGSNDENVTVQQEEIAIQSVNTASYSVDGPVVASDKHRSYRIDVSENVVTMRVYGGYGSFIITEQSYTNTTESYTAFLSALDNANVTERARGTTTEDDYAEVGVCASGRRFILELDTAVRRWSTSCAGNQGTAGFSMPPVATLFQRQVPDFSTLNKGTGL
jgi:hypothetical protein